MQNTSPSKSARFYPFGRISLVTLALALPLALLLTGCGTSRSLVSLDNQYERTRLPSHFDRDESTDDNSVSLDVRSTQRKTMAFRGYDSVPFTVTNARYSVDGTLLLENENQHFGIEAGASPADQGLFRIGAFWGASQQWGSHVLSSFTGGLFMNGNLNKAQYKDVEWILFIPISSIEDSSDGIEPHLEIPLHASVMFDTKTSVSLFVGYSLNMIGIGIKDAGEDLGTHEVSAGIL